MGLIPSRNDVMVNGYRKSLPEYFMRKMIVCPVFKLAKQLFAADKAEATYQEQLAEWNANKTYHQTFEQFRHQKRVVHDKFIKQKLADRKNFK